MKLISETVTFGGRKGPAHPPIYPPCPIELWNPEAFTAGPPRDGFARMREVAPVAWCDEPAGRPGFWAVTRYEDVMRVNGDYETFSSQRGGILMAHEP